MHSGLTQAPQSLARRRRVGGVSAAPKPASVAQTRRYKQSVTARAGAAKTQRWRGGRRSRRLQGAQRTRMFRSTLGRGAYSLGRPWRAAETSREGGDGSGGELQYDGRRVDAVATARDALDRICARPEAHTYTTACRCTYTWASH